MSDERVPELSVEERAMVARFGLDKPEPVELSLNVPRLVTSDEHSAFTGVPAPGAWVDESSTLYGAQSSGVSDASSSWEEDEVVPF